MTNNSFRIDTAVSDEDLRQILDLQAINLPTKISKEEAESQGYVTVQHEFDVLKRMNTPHPHVVARDNHTHKVVGYTLVMLPSFRHDIPQTTTMVDQIDQVVYQGVKLGSDSRPSSKKQNYFLTGQLCVDKAFRGQGVVAAMYREFQRQMEPYFHYVVTVVATKNIRSLRAHEKVGFKEVHRYGVDGEAPCWIIILLPLKSTANVDET